MRGQHVDPGPGDGLRSLDAELDFVEVATVVDVHADGGVGGTCHL